MNFVKPVINTNANANQGSNINFHWMPMKSKYFKDCPMKGTSTDVSNGFLSFYGLSENGFPTPYTSLPNPGYLLWFPPVKKADDTFLIMRATALMTTSLVVRLMTSAPTPDCKYQFSEAKLLPHYTIGNYQVINKYPLSSCLHK